MKLLEMRHIIALVKCTTVSLCHRTNRIIEVSAVLKNSAFTTGNERRIIKASYLEENSVFIWLNIFPASTCRAYSLCASKIMADRLSMKGFKNKED